MPFKPARLTEALPPRPEAQPPAAPGKPGSMAAAHQRGQRALMLLRGLSAVNRTLVEVQSTEALFGQLCQIGVSHLQALVCAIARPAPTGWQMQALAGHSAAGAALATAMTQADSPLHAVLASGRRVVLQDLPLQFERWPALQACMDAGVRALALLPLHHRSDVNGVLCLAATAGAAFDAELLDLLTEIGGDIDHAAQNTLRDLAQLRRAEAAAQAARARSHFIARLSHDLKTPMNAVLGYARQLARADNPPLSDRQRQQAQEIHKAGHQVLALINDILDMDQLESGALRLRLQPVALLPQIDRVQRLLAPQAAQAAVRLQALPPAPGWPAVVADPDRLQQVLVNVVCNAVKYNRRGGQVAVEAGEQAGRVRLTVSDTGPGLSGEQLQHLFEPYNRLGRENDAQPGSGLGLVLARQLLALMDGSIRITSTVAVGTQVHIDLPACDPALVNRDDGVM